MSILINQVVYSKDRIISLIFFTTEKADYAIERSQAMAEHIQHYCPATPHIKLETFYLPQIQQKVDIQQKKYQIQYSRAD